jgi:hypothetical protein
MVPVGYSPGIWNTPLVFLPRVCATPLNPVLLVPLSNKLV